MDLGIWGFIGMSGSRVAGFRFGFTKGLGFEGFGTFLVQQNQIRLHSSYRSYTQKEDIYHLAPKARHYLALYAGLVECYSGGFRTSRYN